MHHGATSGNKGMPVDRTYVGSMPYLLAPLPGTQTYVVGASNNQQIIYTPSVIASPLLTSMPSGSFVLTSQLVSGTAYPVSYGPVPLSQVALPPHIQQSCQKQLQQRAKFDSRRTCQQYGGGNNRNAAANAPGLDPSTRHRKLFVGGLAECTDEEKLQAHFSHFGVIVDRIVIRDPATRESRKFGFVTFQKESEADAALAHKHHVIDGKVVDAKRSIPRVYMDTKQLLTAQNLSPIADKHTIFIAGLPICTDPTHRHVANITLSALRDLFSPHGEVQQIEIILSSRLAFVILDTEEATERALAAHAQMPFEVDGVELNLFRASDCDEPNDKLNSANNDSCRCEKNSASPAAAESAANASKQ